MQFSTILPIAFCLAASTLASPVGLPKGQGQGCGAGGGGGAAAGAKAAAGAGAAAGGVSAQLKDQVAATIGQWLQDINTVNNFVDTVGGFTDPAVISSMAATAFMAAQNEGVSNTELQKDVALDASGQAAAQALVGQFGIIGPAINDTIFNPGNVQKNLDAINGARCPPPQGGDAISQEGAVQAAAASAVGISVPPPTTPTACNVAAAATN